MVAPLIAAGITLYVGVVTWLLCWGLDNFWVSSIGTGDGRNKKGAMLLLLAPIWPAWALVALWHYFIHIIPMLWKEARG